MSKIAIAAIASVLFSGVLTPGATYGEEGATGKETSAMRIVVTSVLVDDQDEALAFYTEVLGFQKKHDIPVGDFRWLTVVSPADPEGTELLLEPNVNPAGQAYQQALFEQGIPATMFGVDDVQAEHRRLESLGVVFRTPPTQMGPVTIAVFEDTCGNLIQIAQRAGHSAERGSRPGSAGGTRRGSRHPP